MSFIGQFVKFFHSELNWELFGKVVSQQYGSITIEYLMDPKSAMFEVFEATVHPEHVVPISLKEKNIVYHQSLNGFWSYGFLERNARNGQLFTRISGEVLTLDKVHILSWNLKDKANWYLQNLVISSRKSVVDRSNFFKSYIRQRALAYGVESSTSSLLNLEDHQLNVAKRVLEDPLRRYVLADEVGLGKTIEAGFVMRQTMFDLNFEARICVICPETLIKQWSEELSEKFQLNLFLSFPDQIGSIAKNSQIEIVPHTALKNAPLYLNHDLVVIDEAHKVMPRDMSSLPNSFFKNTQNLTRDAKSVLLLSATPALHNEFGFLSMLSIIDPASYEIDQISDFKERVKKRVEVAELIAGLSPSNLFLLDTLVDRIRDLFNDSPELGVLLEDFEDYLIDVTDETDPVYLSKLSNLRSYLSEAYKLNHRVIKNRRKNLTFITQNRLGVSHVATKDPNGTFANFNDILENWSIQRSIEDDTVKLKNYADMHFQLREKLYHYYSGNFGQFGYYATNPNFVGDVEQFKQLLDLLRANTFFNRRVLGLKRILKNEFHERAKFVIFTSCSNTADRIYDVLRVEYPEVCYRHGSENENWKAFVDGPFAAILVCDAKAEEGLNIQGSNRYLVHFDLPLNVNRIEQRMGRIDRYGGGDALKSFILLNQADQFEIEWAKLLKSGIKIFDQSVACLQYLIEDHLSGDNFKGQLLSRRTEYISSKKRELQGEQGIIVSALKQLQHEDKLEEIADPPEDLFYELKAYDDNSENIQIQCEPWLRDHLQLSRENRTQSIFEYGYVNNPEKSTTLNREWFGEVKAIEAKATGVRNPIFTYSREAGNKTAGQKPSLLRYGNRFLNSIFSTSRVLPFGKSSLTWVYQPILNRILTEPLIVLKSHIVVEANSAMVQKTIQNWDDPRLKLTNAMIQRRCDALYPPQYHIETNANVADIVDDRTVNTLLNRIDDLVLSNSFIDDGFKFDFSNENLSNFYSGFPDAQNWFEFALGLTKNAYSKLTADHSKKVEDQLPAYRQTLNKRLNRYRSILDEPALDLEEKLNQLLLDAVQTPKINFVACEAFILTGNSELSRQMVLGVK
jgi:ATP-dependent helicase HepA